MCDRPSPWSRRAFVARSTSSLGAAALIPGAFRLPRLSELLDAERPNMDVALAAWRWLESVRVTTDRGSDWPADPNDPDSFGPTLYTHSPGVIPFALELFRATGDEAYLDRAREGVDHLEATYLDPEGLGAGLYTGLGGLAYVFEEVHAASGNARHRAQAERALARIVADATPVGSGLAWPQQSGDGPVEVTDIVSGSSGTGLALLWLHERLGAPEARETAMGVARRLHELAEPMETGARWHMWDGYPREMPNFSHGTAGVAYFLGTAGQATGETEWVDAARAGADYLVSRATVEGDGYRIYHHAPDGEDLYYLSWCHGPVGTNRLFHRLHHATGDASWREWMHRGARGIMGEGVPEDRTPGFWENVSQCCGDAGVGEFFLAFERMTGEAGYGAYAERITASLLGRAESGAAGTSWPQAEHRVQPELVIAQTGFMQGAAGIGTYFLHADLAAAGKAPEIRFPDAPY